MEQDIAKMITLMKAYFDEELDDKRQEYEIVLEDLKVFRPLHMLLFLILQKFVVGSITSNLWIINH